MKLLPVILAHTLPHAHLTPPSADSHHPSPPHLLILRFHYWRVGRTALLGRGGSRFRAIPRLTRSAAYPRGPGCLCLQIMEETASLKIFFCSRFALAFKLICLSCARGQGDGEADDKGAPRTQGNGTCRMKGGVGKVRNRATHTSKVDLEQNFSMLP